MHITQTFSKLMIFIVVILFHHSTNINNRVNWVFLVHWHYTTNATIISLFFIFYVIHNSKFSQLDLSCKNLLSFSVTTMTAHCINFSCLNANSNQISLCTEVSFNFKFAKCCATLTMHSVITSCLYLIRNLFSTPNLNLMVVIIHI